MTIDEYRNRMIQAFHDAECDNLIALVVLPSEKEFEHLEWLLKNHYKTPKDQYEAKLKADIVAMLNELQYDLYHELCKVIHGKEDCPCTNQTTSCLATFRVCDADRAIGRIIKQKINKLKAESEKKK